MKLTNYVQFYKDVCYNLSLKGLWFTELMLMKKGE